MPPLLLADQSRPHRKASNTLREDEGARPRHLRETNSRLLLRILRENNPCSKADMVRISGLSAPTVSAAVSDLIDQGLAELVGEGRSSGGRPAELLRFNPSHTYVAGADIGGTSLRMMLADLDGNAIATWSTRLSAAQKSPDAVVALMATGLREMTVETGSRKRVRHIAVGAPGITDVHRGTVRAAPNLHNWIDVPLKSMVESVLRLPATVENDVNLAAVGEGSRGVAQGLRDFIFIAIGTGVGAGIYLRGELHHGATWSAGEIGYLPVVGLPRERILLDETGQLERAIGGAGIENAWRSALERNGIDDASLQKLRATRIFDLAAQGHAIARDIVEHVARTLADAIGILGLLYDPGMVVLGGGIGSHPFLRDTAEHFLREHQIGIPQVKVSTLGKQAQLFGAVALSLSAVEADLLC